MQSIQFESFAPAEAGVPSIAPAPPAASADDEPPRLRLLDLAELLTLEIMPRGMLLDPIIPERGLAMLYAARGIGKTHVALGIAHAVATGTDFLAWNAPKPRRVLLVDGEMPAIALRERLKAIVAGSGVAPAPGMLTVLAGDLIDGGIGNLAEPSAQAELEARLDGIALLILDNLSSLTYVLREDYSGWGPIQQWLIRLRRRGISTLLVHHAGRDGEQRGTNRREDVLDTTICLSRPFDYRIGDGARFEVHVEKERGLLGAAARPFEASLRTAGGKACWTTRTLADVAGPRVAELLNAGFSMRDIARETGLSTTTVHRMKTAMLAQAAAQEGAEADAEEQAVL
jgi:putative DNA primase/helicase